MSISTVVILNAVLVIALFGVLAYVLRIPFRIGSPSLPEPVSIETYQSEELAA